MYRLPDVTLLEGQVNWLHIIYLKKNKERIIPLRNVYAPILRNATETTAR